jgi:hypothetical protein
VSDAGTVTEVGARPPERPAGLRRRLGGWAGAAAVVFAALTAAAVTLAHIGSDSLSTNEAISFQIARLPWIPLPDVIVEREANMGAYYLLLHWWTAFGDSEASIRGLSLLAALLAIPILYGLVRRLFGARPAMAAVVAFGVNPFMVMYAQHARGYALVLLLVTAASYSFVRGVQEGSWRWWAAYAVAGAVGIYAHLFAMLVLAAHLVSLAFLPRRQVPWARLCSSLAGMTVLLVPLGLFLATRRVALIEWVEWPGPAALPGLLARYAGSRPLLVAYAVAGAVAVERTVQRWRRGGLERWGNALVWSWLVVPILAALLISAADRPVFVPAAAADPRRRRARRLGATRVDARGPGPGRGPVAAGRRGCLHPPAGARGLRRPHRLHPGERRARRRDRRLPPVGAHRPRLLPRPPPAHRSAVRGGVPADAVGARRLRDPGGAGRLPAACRRRRRPGHRRPRPRLAGPQPQWLQR